MFGFKKQSLISIGILACLCLMIISGCSSKQPTSKEVKYPTENITIYVGFNAGGSTDMTARTISEYMAKKLGKSVIVVNKPGSNGALVASEVAKMKPDGYNLVIASGGNMSIIPNNSNIGYTHKDFTPLAQLTGAPSCLAVAKDFPAKDLKEFIQYAKKNKGKLRYANTGLISTQQLAVQKLDDIEGLDLQSVPFSGSPAAIAAMLGKHVEAVSAMTTDFVAQAPLVRVLAVFGDERDPMFPDAPTMKELGYKDFEVFSIWYGIVGPKGMPEAVVKKLEETLASATKDPEILAQWKKMNLRPAYLDGKTLGQEMERRSGFFKQIIDKIKAEGNKK